jgi:hypothetical protein
MSDIADIKADVDAHLCLLVPISVFGQCPSAATCDIRTKELQYGGGGGG